MLGPTFNFGAEGSDLTRAFFFSPMAGFSALTISSSNQTVFAYNVGVGKRFPIAPSISWKPTFSVIGTSQGNTFPTYQIMPVRFTFFLGSTHDQPAAL